MKKDRKTETVIVRISRPLNSALEAETDLQHVKKSEIVRKALKVYLLNCGYARLENER